MRHRWINLNFAIALGAMGLAGLSATPAHAELPEPVREMLEAAIATGDPAKVATVAELSRQLHPGDAAEITDILAEFTAQRAALAAQETARAAAKAAEAEEAIRRAGLLQNWSGEGEIGLLRTTGNSRQAGLTAGLEITRTGIDWTHKVIALGDYQESAGLTTREQYSLAYEPRYSLSQRFFLSGLAQWERDSFQGFDNRYSLSGGFGYRFIDTPDTKLSLESGPALRRTEFIDGTTRDNLAARYAVDFDWQITDRIKFTEDASAILQFGNDTLLSRTAIEASISERLSTRLSYLIEHDTEPPLNSVKTDTRTRFTLIYGF